MILPDGWKEFKVDVQEKIQELCKSGIWNIDADLMMAWLGNFESDDRYSYIAHHILDRLIFRTEKMTESSYKRFLSSDFRSYIQDFRGSLGESVEEWLEGLADKNCDWTKDIKLCSVTKSGENGESGSHIIRLLTGGLFSESHIYSLDVNKLTDLEDKVIIIVDDFVGSGAQFSKFAKEVELEKAAENNHIIYVPSLAFYKGVEYIDKKNYGIKVYPLETVTKKEQFFLHEDGAMFCGDDVNSEKDIIDCYKEMRGLSGKFKEFNWLGFDQASLCVGFQWGCPNQSLGAMWFDGGTDWNKLLRRRGSQ
ncbi:MAG: hypothetical protein COA71_00380 [SAR86 cluster bacterium]|uniref:PRTase-CE domain-containing protein n=1 Tax=SAR86 cluster bacterium TaxID=2030880 RepID=A0A2A5CHJ7_9GAMM|nr:MAG: hypothetical protein COA71_00380 [SAR86 cluster bacterium]